MYLFIKLLNIFKDIIISFRMECPEAVERGRNFRLLKNEELPELLDFLTRYLPVSLKVSFSNIFKVKIFFYQIELFQFFFSFNYLQNYFLL